MALRHFLLIYDHRQGRLVEQADLGGDWTAAAQKYAECEGEYADREGFEIVLVGADSLETIQKTHAHYFQGATRPELPFPELANA